MYNRVIVVYHSVDGATKSYAEWIAKVLSADIIDFDHANKKILRGYDTVIFGSCVRMGIIAKLDKFRDKINKLDKLKLIIFTVGMVKATVGNIMHLANKNKIDINDKFFYLKGEFNIMNRKNNFEVAMLSKTVASMKRGYAELNASEQYLIECCQEPHDWRNPQNIKPIIALIDKDLVSKVDEIQFTHNDYTDYINRSPIEVVSLRYRIDRR